MKRLSLSEKQESIEVLNYQIRACENCVLHTTRLHALTGEGNINSPVMFVALSPGEKENVENKMFIGPSGQVFNKLLKAAGIQRQLVFMTNLVKCMLPKNRKPRMDEIEACSPFLEEEITIINPEIIVPLGAYATNAILTKFNMHSVSAGMNFSSLNGKIFENNNKKIYPLPHPAALLYNPGFEMDIIEKYKILKEYF